ncbi:MAG: hypothetical protein U9O41_08710, partial [Candidatus Aerophobetes bacterium]|nr:hypothetical protein [Candidatus Aerophobetes bacterium]
MKAITEAKPIKLLALGNLKEKANQIFSLLDISSSTREDYTHRIGLFLQFISEKGFTRDSFLEFKRYLQEK